MGSCPDTDIDPRFVRNAPPWSPDPYHTFLYRIQQGINFSWGLKIPTLEVVTKNGLGMRVARLPGCK